MKLGLPSGQHLVLAVALGGVFLFACRPGDEARGGNGGVTSGQSTVTEPNQPPPPSGPGALQERPRVVFTPPGRAPVEVTVEIVDTPPKIRRGLMYRSHLPADQGMLFLMGRLEDHSFWMKNTLIPLDMIFIGPDLTVVGVVERAEPKTLTGRSVGVPSLYVLEVNGGWTAEHGVGPGTPLRFEGVPGH